MYEIRMNFPTFLIKTKQKQNKAKQNKKKTPNMEKNCVLPIIYFFQWLAVAKGNTTILGLTKNYLSTSIQNICLKSSYVTWKLFIHFYIKSNITIYHNTYFETNVHSLTSHITLLCVVKNNFPRKH